MGLGVQPLVCSSLALLCGPPGVLTLEAQAFAQGGVHPGLAEHLSQLVHQGRCTGHLIPQPALLLLAHGLVT
jgi:hypothetical protein